MNLYLVRHAESMGDALNLIEGRADFPLTKKKKNRAEDLAEHFASVPIDRILSSPLSRSMQTANIIGRRLNVPIIECEDFTSYDNGKIAGLTLAEADQKYPKPKVKYAHTEIYGMESMVDFRSRIEKGLYHILFDGNEEDNVLIVTHGGVINEIIKIFLDIPVTRDYSFASAGGSFAHLEYCKDGSKKILSINRQI